MTDSASSGVQWGRVARNSATVATDPGVRPPVPVFREVYEAHVDMVWRTLLRTGVPAAQVDDAAQDVFLAVHNALPRWQRRASLRTWIYRIARNAGINRVRSLRRKPDGQPTARADEAASRRPDPESTAARNEALTELVALLETIDEDKREVLLLVELEGFTAPEIAELLTLPLNTVYSRLRIARAELDNAVRMRGAR